VSLIVNNEKHLLRALADTGVRSSIILEACTLAPFIKTDDSNTTTWSTMGGKCTTIKTGFVTFSLPEFNLKKQMCTSCAFHVDDRSESLSTYDMIMGQDLLGESVIIMNFNDHTVNRDTDTIPMNDRVIALYQHGRLSTIKQWIYSSGHTCNLRLPVQLHHIRVRFIKLFHILQFGMK
jgi:hypothetical protein